MNRTILIALILHLVMGLNLLYGQRSKATDKGTTLISGSFSFSNQGGDLYKGASDDRRTTITITPGAVHFISPGVGLGGELSYTSESQGEESFTTW